MTTLDLHSVFPISEAAFQSKILELSRLYGYLSYHTWNSRNSAKGFPDLVLCRPGDSRLLCFELKTETGKASPEQVKWIAALDSVPGVTAGIYRPSDMKTIEQLLRGKR